MLQRVRAGGCSHARRQLGVAKQALDLGSPVGGVVALDQYARLAVNNRLAQATGRGGDHRNARRGRLERDEPLGF